MNTIKFNKKNTKVIAHRGLSGIEVENTNAAFVAAGNRSYYGIETDIHRTSDGNFVIGHDDNYNRLAGEEIYLEKSSLSDLQKVVFFDKDGVKDREDLRPSRLENYIKIVKKYECNVQARLMYRLVANDTLLFRAEFSPSKDALNNQFIIIASEDYSDRI